MAIILQVLHEHINTALPDHTCLVGTVLPDGYAQITMRGSVFVYDDEHIGMWDRGRGSTAEHIQDGSKVTIFFRKRPLRDTILPKSGVARFYGVAKVHKSGPVRDEIYACIVEGEQKADPEKKGFGVLVRIERAEDFSGAPLAL
ncbi:MAG: pyridoxamine 5'-phosphate oxidase family protein [Bradyrhizobiaceae bacterium]|nr:pyridoxamine 5'-phosphate oxidase family protein [Bradyrhizobiaceae bacterium]